MFLVDGTELGPRTIEIGNWSGKAVFSSRSTIGKKLGRPEFDRPGVYLLKSLPNNSNYNERIYIGEAEKLNKRLKRHLADSDKEITEVVVFTSKDEMLTKSHIKYLESRIITLAIEAKTAEIENVNQPELPSLPEADISDMEYFLEQIKIILPVVNFMLLVPSVVEPSQSNIDTLIPDETKIYQIKTSALDAKLIETDNGFIVLTDSQANKSVSRSISEGWIKQRNKLIETGVLVDDGNYYLFKENAIFSSISAAASIVLGRQAAGPIEWIDENGNTYKQNQEDQFQEGLDED